MYLRVLIVTRSMLLEASTLARKKDKPLIRVCLRTAVRWYDASSVTLNKAISGATDLPLLWMATVLPYWTLIATGCVRIILNANIGFWCAQGKAQQNDLLHTRTKISLGEKHHSRVEQDNQPALDKQHPLSRKGEAERRKSGWSGIFIPNTSDLVACYQLFGIPH